MKINKPFSILYRILIIVMFIIAMLIWFDIIEMNIILAMMMLCYGILIVIVSIIKISKLD